MLKSLNVAQSGLSAAKIAVENVSNNIANENTPGYKKRVVQLSELALSDSRFTGRGVQADESYRITSQYMYDNMLKENTKSNYYDEISSMVGNVEAMFQETDTSGFSYDLNNYFQSVENLRSNPNSEIYKASVQTQGTSIVDSLQNLYSNIEKQEEITRSTLNDNVDAINSILNEIGSINEQMGRYSVESNDLLDKRDLLEKELSTYVDIEVDRTDGEYELKIGNTTAVRYNTSVREINIVEENVAQVDRFATVDASGYPIDSIDQYNTLASGDIVTYKFNNEYEISVEIGDTASVDLNGDGTLTTETIDEDNYIRILAYKINHDTNISENVIAYNGNYTVDDNGDKITTTSSDKYLVIESKIEGTDGSFEGRIAVTKSGVNDTIFKDEDQSIESSNTVYLAAYDSEIKISSGSVKAELENLTSTSYNNKIADYKNKLDDFARSLSDMYDKFVETDAGEYLYGHVSSDSYNGAEDIANLNLFSGGDVKSLKFNENAVNDLDQSDLDYISQIQWKKDVEFDGFAQDGSNESKTSFSEYFQEIRVNISSDKENNDSLLKTQEAVSQSLQSNYDQLTKVDSDEEMVNLIKFQAAYTANAKIITVVDEMLQTILNIK